MTFTEDDLRAVLAERSTPSRVPPDLAGRAERRGRSRHRRRLTVGATALVTGAATVTVVVAQLGPDRPAAPAFSPSPSILGGYGKVVPVPDVTSLNRPEVHASLRSIVEVTGTAPRCRRRLHGTGFVYARERVMTNAHDVAGVRGPLGVRAPNGDEHQGRVVLYDPARDIAVLYVPGLAVPSLGFNRTARAGDVALIAGFPAGRSKPLTATAGTIRTRQSSSGPDIYHSGQVTRGILTFSGRVEPGNSGGPLLSDEGLVYGVIFAAAPDDQHGGYALTADEVAADAQAGATATKPVSTQACVD
jgi:S1-C subfamily serine protease